MQYRAKVYGFDFNTGTNCIKTVNLYTTSKRQANRIIKNFDNYYSLHMRIDKIELTH